MLERDINAFLIGNHLKLLSMKSRAGGYVWEVKSMNSSCPCLRCGSVRTVKAGKASSCVREEPVRNVSVWMKIHKHRYFCKDCKSTFTEHIKGIWPKKRSTQRFRRFIGQAAGRMTDLSSVSRFYNVSHGFVYKAYYEQVGIKLNEYKSKRHWPEVIGIDEHFFRRVKGKGTEFVTMITDLKNKKVFDLVQGKDHRSLP